MNIDAALAMITGIDGTGVDLGERPPVWPDFPIEEYRRRYARLAALMDSQGFDALVLTQEEPVRYLSGYNSVIWAVGRWLPTIFIAARDPRQAVLMCSSFDASRAFSTCMCVVCGLMTCSFSAGSTGVDPEQFEEPGLQGRGSWDLGRSGSTGGHEPQAGQGGEDEPSGGLCCLPCP
jgi:hypothetical protein